MKKLISVDFKNWLTRNLTFAFTVDGCAMPTVLTTETTRIKEPKYNEKSFFDSEETCRMKELMKVVQYFWMLELISFI